MKFLAALLLQVLLAVGAQAADLQRSFYRLPSSQVSADAASSVSPSPL